MQPLPAVPWRAHPANQHEQGNTQQDRRRPLGNRPEPGQAQNRIEDRDPNPAQGGRNTQKQNQRPITMRIE